MRSRPVLLTKRTHACVELKHDQVRIVIDPGSLGDDLDLAGVAAVLVSHGHFDHASGEILERAVVAGIPVHGPADLAIAVRSTLLGSWLSVLQPGDLSDIAGFNVKVLGGRHAPVHPERPGPINLSFLIDGRILITGDQHPAAPPLLEALITPIDAPWLRAVDLIEYVRRVRPKTVIGVHEGLLNIHGLAVADSVLASLTGEGAGEAIRLEPGEELLIE